MTESVTPMKEPKRSWHEPAQQLPKARLFALIVAAGVGARAGGTLPKQYQTVMGRSLLAHSATTLLAVANVRVFVAVAPGDPLAPAHSCGAKVLECGGSTRAQTVANGLRALLGQGARLHDWCLVHDAARCLVLPEQVQNLIDACAGDDIGEAALVNLGDQVGGLLAQPVADTLKAARDGRSVDTLDRSDKWLAQTPQMFRIGVLIDALALAGDAVTDEASAIEALGLKPLLIKGGAHNFKITHPEDFALAHAVLAARSPAEVGSSTSRTPTP